jgi:hypothetical protein
MERLKRIVNASPLIKWNGHIYLQLLVYFLVLSDTNFQK